MRYILKIIANIHETSGSDISRIICRIQQGLCLTRLTSYDILNHFRDNSIMQFQPSSEKASRKLFDSSKLEL